MLRDESVRFVNAAGEGKRGWGGYRRMVTKVRWTRDRLLGVEVRWDEVKTVASGHAAGQRSRGPGAPGAR